MVSGPSSAVWEVAATDVAASCVASVMRWFEVAGLVASAVAGRCFMVCRECLWVSSDKAVVDRLVAYPAWAVLFAALCFECCESSLPGSTFCGHFSLAFPAFCTVMHRLGVWSSC